MGLVAIGAASALIAFSPNVLFPPLKEPNLQLPAPNASREVARVSAAVPPARHEGGSSAAQPAPASGAPVAGGAIAAASTGGEGRAVTTGDKAGRQIFRSGDAGKGSKGSAETPTITSKSHGKGKAKGHFKDKSNGKAKGHSKKKHHG